MKKRLHEHPKGRTCHRRQSGPGHNVALKFAARGTVGDNAQLHGMIASQTALGRVGEAQDVGAAMVALLSDDMGWVNGQRVEVSGGIHL